MRFKIKSKPEYGDIRIFTYFAWIPVCCYRFKVSKEYLKEIRWLEKVTVKQEYIKSDDKYLLEILRGDRWVNRQFWEK